MKTSKIPLSSSKAELPLVILSDVVVFPQAVAPFHLKESQALKALDMASQGRRDVFLAYQKERIPPSNHKRQLYDIGTIGHILQILKLPDGSSRILVEGRGKGEILKIFKKRDVPFLHYRPIEETQEIGRVLEVSTKSLQETFLQFARGNDHITREFQAQIDQVQTPEKLIALLTTQLQIPMNEKIAILELERTKEKIDRLSEIIQMEIEKHTIRQGISGRVRERMEKNQKEYFLNEQIKEIQKELGQEEEDPTGATELKGRILALSLPKESKEKALKEAKRLARLQPMSPDAGALRTYLEWIVDLPWSKMSDDRIQVSHTKRILDEDHYDMEKAKERILDYISIRQIKEDLKGPILCFLGPPGTGKTSLARSVARGINREFVRISLGGVRDEAEIRGHRRTYVGALPGKIIQSIKGAGTTNPVLLLDEIDKMSNDFRGDPAAALLEVLDPEQNNSFTDHYLELPYDLSKVMFITTANSLHGIPRPLLDRMEVIEVPGYTEVEKIRIAKDFIVPKQLRENGVDQGLVSITDRAIQSIIRGYTMESGVRNLERSVGQVIRKMARSHIENHQRRSGGNNIHSARLHKHQDFFGAPEKGPSVPDFTALEVVIDTKEVLGYLGKPLIQEDDKLLPPIPGLATGMAWTEVGGNILPVEVSLLKGEGKLLLTGKLGDVMKESAQIALSYLRNHCKDLGIDGEFQKEQDIHIHVPEGAVPKDGPSAGITMVSAILSALKGVALKPKVAMTGEITLTGRLLPIGGVKEKILAAHRNECETILLPERNRRDQEELPQEIKEDLNFIFSTTIQGALNQIFPEGTFPEEDSKLS